MTDHVQQQLPAAFSDLEGWIDWSLPTQKQRYAKRAQSTLSDLRAFSSALTPRMHDLIQHLDSFAWGSNLNPTDERLYHLGLAYWEATIPLDLKWKSPIAQDSFPVERLTIPDAYRSTSYKDGSGGRAMDAFVAPSIEEGVGMEQVDLDRTSTRKSAAPAHAPSTVRDVMYDFFRQVGIHRIFGNPGSTELAMFRDFPSDFEYVLALHEGVVVGMADGHAIASGNAVVVNLHSAAGVGNAMGSIFTAFRSQAPLVIIAGQQSRSILPYEPFLYSERATELPRPYVKWSIEPARAEDVPAAIARAYYIAMQEPRGPTFVSVPADDWDRTCDPLAARDVNQIVRTEPEALAKLKAALDAAKNPVFIVGQGNANAGVWQELIDLAELHEALVYTGAHAARNSFPEDHPLFAGHLLWDRAPQVKALAGHDLIVVLGAPAFVYHVEGEGPFIPEAATLWQITDDFASASWSPVGSAVVGNMKLAICDLLDGASPPRRTPPARREKAPEPAVDRLTDAYLMSRIEKLHPHSRVIVCEAPSSLNALRAQLPIKEAAGYYCHASGGLGYGLASAVGIAMVETERRVIALIGDGSSMYAIQALWTAAKLGLRVVFVIVNNQAYQALVGFAKLIGMGTPVGIVTDDLDFVKLANGMAMEAASVSDPEALDGALARAFAAEGPYLLDVRTVRA